MAFRGLEVLTAWTLGGCPIIQQDTQRGQPIQLSNLSTDDIRRQLELHELTISSAVDLRALSANLVPSPACERLHAPCPPRELLTPPLLPLASSDVTALSGALSLSQQRYSGSFAIGTSVAPVLFHQVADSAPCAARADQRSEII